MSAVQNALASAPHPPEEAAAQLEEAASFQGFIGRSPAMTDIYRMVRAIGRSTATVFISGESGTGKGGWWRARCTRCRRGSTAPFVAVNCAALPES